MNKKTLLSEMMKRLNGGSWHKKQASRGTAMVAAVALIVQTVFPSMAIAANELGSYNEFQLTPNAPVISYNSGNGTFNVALTGTGDASPYTSTSFGYYVRINWADGDVALSDTPSSGVTDTFYTPDFGATMLGDWSGEHTFDGEGTYNIVIEWLRNPNQPHGNPVLAPADSDLGNDEIRARITVPVVLEVPSQPTDESATICVDEEGYHVTIAGSENISPYTSTSLGYYVRANWDDGNTSYSDTPGSDLVDTFFTPDFGATLLGDWSGEHLYTAEGEYDVTLDLLRNPNQPHGFPILTPASTDLANDILQKTQNIHINTADAVPCNPPQQEPEPEELPLDINVDDVTVCKAGEAYEVAIGGTGGGSPYKQTSYGYYIHVNWDDSTADNSDTPGSDAVDTFYTPNFGATLAGTWDAEHTYTSADLYDVTVQMFRNPNQPHSPPALIPAASDLSNDELMAATTVEINLTGEIAACDTSDQGSANLTIIKQWEGISETPSEVSGSFDGGAFILNASSSWSTQFIRVPGIYALSEDAIDGYTSSIQCSVYFDEQSGALTLTNGDNATCTITNTEILGEGTVTIEKVWSFADASSTNYPDFSITLDGNDVGITSATSVSATMTVTEGTHTIAETISGFDMALTCEATNGQATSSVAVTDGSFTVNEDDSVYCFVINTEQSSENSGGDGDGGSVINSLSNNVPNDSTGGSNGTPTTPSGDIELFTFGEPRVEGIQDTDETILTCAEQYPEAALITGDLDDLLAAYGFTRNTGLESTYATTLVPKILVPGAPLGSEQILQNFIVYGIQTLLELGAGERAGIVASFVNLYGHLPENECDWQNVIRIGQGVVPVVKSSERELLVEGVFAEVYDRAPNREVTQDNVTVLIMTYGLRPDVRSLQAEIQAANIFKGIYGHFPQNTGEWDIMRGIAYGGITVPGYSPIVR